MKLPPGWPGNTAAHAISSGLATGLVRSASGQSVRTSPRSVRTSPASPDRTVLCRLRAAPPCKRAVHKVARRAAMELFARWQSRPRPRRRSEVVFLCITTARRELPLLPPPGRNGDLWCPAGGQMAWIPGSFRITCGDSCASGMLRLRFNLPCACHRSLC